MIARKPDLVTLLIGMNDVRFGAGEGFLSASVSEVLTRLRVGTRARIAVLEIPMLGEDLGSGLNQRVRRGNQALRKVAAAHGVPCLPLYDRLAALLPPDHRPPAYAFSALSAVKAALAHRIRHRSWSEIARRNGLAVLTDHLHLSEPGAEAVADLIGGFLEAQSA